MMRCLIYMVLFVLFACSSKEKRYKESVLPAEVVADEVQSVLKGDSYEYLLSEKLINYVDLLHLKDKHPDFKEDVLLQLEELSEREVIDLVKSSEEKIKNIRIHHPVKIVSDSVKEFTIKYQLFSNSKQIEDSIFAKIITKKVIVDNQPMQSNTIKFSKNQTKK